VPRHRSAGSRSSSSSRGARATPEARLDGKIDVHCPDCGTRFRIAGDLVDQKIECAECHRVFFAKASAKRVRPPNYTKAYVTFALVGLGIVGLFWALSNDQEKSSNTFATTEPAAAPAKPAPIDRTTHPRAHQVFKWAAAVGDDNRLILKTHSDLVAIGRTLGVANPRNQDAVLAALATDESSKYLREMAPQRAVLNADDAMDGPKGRATVFLTGKPGTKDFQSAEAEVEVMFQMDGEQVKVTGWMVTRRPGRTPTKPAK
jgi:hypothetical protein